MGVCRGNELLSYSFPRPHPFTSERVATFWRELDLDGQSVDYIKPQKADEGIIELFHSKEHVEFVKKASHFGYGNLDQGDTPAFSGVFEAAQFAVGSSLACLQEIMEGRLEHAFNPVGGLHHATRDSSAGFCVFNDIGVVVEVLRSQYEVKKVLYVDIDVHHGDGVYYPYESDPYLSIFDIHEDGRYLYPGTGSASETGLGVAKGTKVNVPLSPGTGDEGVIDQLPRLESLARVCSPEFIIFQCGADGLAGDPIAGLSYSREAHKAVASTLHRLSHELCGGRLLALGGGGYKPENCASAWLAVVKALGS